MLKASKYEASHKIRFLRVVVDYNVDRMQVYRQRCHSRALLIARPLSSGFVRVGYIRLANVSASSLNWIFDILLEFYFSSCHNLIEFIQVVIARGFHLFPFRTEKLSSLTPMVLRFSRGRVGSRRFD